MFAESTPIAAAPAPSGVGLIYDAKVCSLAIHGDHELTWTAPPAAWDAQDSRFGAILVAPLALPPGSYTIVSYEIADHWDQGHSPDGRLMGTTPCAAATRHATVQIAFTVPANGFTLASVPAGHLGFAEYRQVIGAKRTLGAWYPQLEAAALAMRDAIVASLRDRRDGYDVYPNCDQGTSVIRDTGKPFAFVTSPDDQDVREKFRRRALGALHGVHSVHSNGFGGSCKGTAAFMVTISDPKELETVVREYGEWLVRNNFQGAITIMVGGEPRLL